MGKLGKKARKFAKKNLQSVLKRKRKINSMIKKKHSSASRGKGDTTEEQVAASTVPPTGRASEDIGDTSLDSIFSEDDSDSMGDSSDSDGFLSEDPGCAYNSESENEDELDKDEITLLGNNKEIQEELSKEKKRLDQMKEKDPNFSKFLESQNVKQFNDEIANAPPPRAEGSETFIPYVFIPPPGGVDSLPDITTAARIPTAGYFYPDYIEHVPAEHAHRALLRMMSMKLQLENNRHRHLQTGFRFPPSPSPYEGDGSASDEDGSASAEDDSASEENESASEEEE